MCCGAHSREEQQQEEERLRFQCHVPDPYPKIQWAKLNKWAVKNLPQPDAFPVQSCPADPQFYAKQDKKYEDRMRGMGLDSKVYSYGGPCQACKTGWTSSDCGCIRCQPPFGKDSGFATNEGIIAPPEVPVHGYIYTKAGWMIYTKHEQDKGRPREQIQGA